MATNDFWVSDFGADLTGAEDSTAAVAAMFDAMHASAAATGGTAIGHFA